MKVVLHDKAEEDLAAAIDYYVASAGRSVAERFISEFERVAVKLLAHPGLGTSIPHGRRIFPFQVFPYSVVYRETDEGLLILVVRHQHRKPGFGLRRR